jgi:hypothetical protein
LAVLSLDLPCRRSTPLALSRLEGANSSRDFKHGPPGQGGASSRCSSDALLAGVESLLAYYNQRLFKRYRGRTQYLAAAG